MGPSKGVNILREFLKIARPKSSVAVAYLDELSEKLDEKFDHYVTVILDSAHAPFISVFYDSKGRIFVGMSARNPMEDSSALYKVPFDTSEFIAIYTTTFSEKANVRVRVLQSPVVTPFFCVCGDVKLVSKLELKEKLNNVSSITFAAKIDDETLDFLMKNYNRIVEKEWGRYVIIPKGEVLNIAILYDRMEGVAKSLVVEVARMHRNNLITNFSRYFREPGGIPETKERQKHLVSFAIPLESLKVFRDRLEAVIEEFVRSVNDSVSGLKNRTSTFLEGVKELLEGSS